MTITTPIHQSDATRRVGYLAAAAVNMVVLYLVNVSPGWQAVPFLTDDTNRVLGLLNASFAVGVAANLLYLLVDPAWLRASGELLTTAVGIAALTRVWQVFPFDFGDASVDWALWVRIALVVSLAGSAIGMFAHAVALVRAVACLPAGSDQRPCAGTARREGQGADQDAHRV